jgi:endoglucanase
VRGGAALAAVLIVAALGAFAPGAAGKSTTAKAFVRVDQVGYPTSASKRAYLMSRRGESGAPFTVRNAEGASVYAGTVGASVGAWSKRFKYVYALDFDSAQAPGTYTISVAGRTPASSPPFAIASARSLYEGPLANTLSFYENERDGPEYIASALRTAPGHLNDEHAMTYVTPKVNEEGEFKGELESLGETIDAAGGWWDAGDYLKFVQTTSYAVDVMLAGVRDFRAQMGAASARSSFTEEARFGVEWLLRMWNDSTRTLYYQVGIGEGNSTTVGDHDIWRLPQEDDSFGGEDPADRFIRHRPVFRAGPPGSPISPNLAGRDAAAFAECFQAFHETRPELADRCLTSAEHIYELAGTDPKGNLLTAIPFGFYPETEWRDDLELGATELADALATGAPLPSGLPQTQPQPYLEDAAHWAGEYLAHNGEGGEGLNLYDVSGLADFELVRALRAAGEQAGLAVSEAQLIAGLGLKLQVASEQSQQDPFGFGFPWSEADTVSHGDGLSVMASEYDYLVGEPLYEADAGRWLANMLGANAWGSSFIVGDGSTFPDCLQHQVANIVGSLDGGSPVLDGAVVEGPSGEPSSGKLPGMRACPTGGGTSSPKGEPFKVFNSASAKYEDNVQAFTNTEPAIDLTASSMLAFSWLSAEGHIN